MGAYAFQLCINRSQTFVHACQFGEAVKGGTCVPAVIDPLLVSCGQLVAVFLASMLYNG